MPGRKEIIQKSKGEIQGRIGERGYERSKLLTELSKAKEKSEIDRINAEIEKCSLDIKIMSAHAELLGELGELSENSAAIDQRITDVRQGATDMTTTLGEIKVRDEILQGNLRDTNIKIDRTKELLETYIETYKKDSKVNLGMAIGGVVLSIFGLIAGLTGVGIAAPALAPKPDTTPKPTPSPLRSARASTGGAGARPADSPGAQELSDDEVEKMMQDLVVNKAVIASGKVPQGTMWKNLAAVADTTDLEGQDWTLIFIEEAALHLPGREEFFWLDPSEATERYEALRAAYKKSKKLSDVYLAATQIKYNGKEVPTFHVALLIQWALKLIKHDQLFPSADAAAHA